MAYATSDDLLLHSHLQGRSQIRQSVSTVVSDYDTAEQVTILSPAEFEQGGAKSIYRTRTKGVGPYIRPSATE